jgi:hypothetical protein
MSIPKICSKLRKNKAYRRKREMKANEKGGMAESLQSIAD